MPKYVIERDLPGAGDLSDDDISAISQKSNNVLTALGGDVQWLHSHVTADKLFCVYIAPHEDRVREHATRGGFPANAVRQVTRTIDSVLGDPDLVEPIGGRVDPSHSSVEGVVAGRRAVIEPRRRQRVDDLGRHPIAG